MFEHRKYHGLYFILGFIIAAMLVMLLGCKPADTTGGTFEPAPPQCCQAFIPECMACQEGIPEDVWLENTCGSLAIDAEYYGWDEDKNEPIWLCQAEIID